MDPLPLQRGRRKSGDKGSKAFTALLEVLGQNRRVCMLVPMITNPCILIVAW